MPTYRFEDLYEILQVSPFAEPEVIEVAYKKLAQKYHPDINKSPLAVEKMKKINIAHDVLSDPMQRQKYYSEWLQRKQGKHATTRPYANIKPKPVVKPSYICFDDIEPGQIKKTSFIIDNTGGRYSKISVSNPQTWLRVLTPNSNITTGKLPLEVKIEAKGLDWGETGAEHIKVRLDTEETIVKAEIQMKPKPGLAEFKATKKAEQAPVDISAAKRDKSNQIDILIIIGGTILLVIATTLAIILDFGSSIDISEMPAIPTGVFVVLIALFVGWLIRGGK